MAGPDVNGIGETRPTGGVFWTLRMEWLFYLLLPALVWFRKWWRLPILFAIVYAVRAVIDHLHTESSHFFIIFFLLRNFFSLLISSFSVGMIAAYHPWGEKVERVLRSWYASVIGLALLCVAFFAQPAIYNVKESALLAPVFFMIVAGNTFFGVLSSRPMRSLGQISYSVYIFHGLILFTLTTWLNRIDPIKNIPPITYWGFVWCIGAIVTCWCTLSYWFVERPFLPGRGTARKTAPPHANLVLDTQFDKPA
jgi:peptidoglycan/LPS O-acetylase OafA/YrhL